MFLLESLLVISAVYWCSALISESVFTSGEEQQLPHSVRIGLAYFLSLAYFSSAWLIMPIREAWALGILLLALHLAGRYRTKPPRQILLGAKKILLRHAKLYGIFLLGANIYFIPLHASMNYGPFTESGGDITVYSDVAKYLTDRNLTATGLEASSTMGERVNSINLLKHTSWGHPQPSDKYKSLDESLFNPPYADYQTIKLAYSNIVNPNQFAPYAQFAFPPAKNYPVFFGIQAFLYVCILAGMWGLFRRFGFIPGIVAVVLVAASHALISVSYNMYALQMTSIVFLALVLGSLPNVRLLTIAGLRTYGPGAAYIFVGYPHFLPIAAPFFAIAGIKQFYIRIPQPHLPDSGVFIRYLQRLLHFMAGAIIVLLILMWIDVGSKNTLTFIQSLLAGITYGAPVAGASYYIGDFIPIISWQWFGFLFGTASQQHFMPFVVEWKSVWWANAIAVVSGLSAFVLGLLALNAVVTRSIGSQRGGTDIWKYVFIYLAALLVSCVYLYMAQASLYKQAKGAEYVLLCVYIVLLLPFALYYQLTEKNKKNKFTVACAIVLLVFISSLFVIRLAFAYRLAYQRDRGVILESSYFSQAKKIRRQDDNPFVLFEPRKSADLYLSSQSFSGLKMIPTRHMVLQKYDRKTETSTRMIPSDFVNASDLPHLWTLTAKQNGIGKYEWQSEKIINRRIPKVYFFGDTYEIDFMKEPRENDFLKKSRCTGAACLTSDIGIFSFINNGAAMLYLPPGCPVEVELMLYPRNGLLGSDNYKSMSSEIEGYIYSGQLPSPTKFQANGVNIYLQYHISSRKNATLIPIVRYSKDYWVNIRLDGRELENGE